MARKQGETQPMITITRPYMKVSKIEKCSKCGAFREWSIYETGMKERNVWSLRGVKCNHCWREATPEEIGK